MLEVSPLFGDVLVRMGVVTRGQVEEALSVQALSGQRVGEALIALGYVTREQLETALAEALGLPRGEKAGRPPLGELLIGLKYLTPEQLQEGLALQKQSGRRIGEVLVEKGFCTYRQLYEGLSLQQRMGSGATASASATVQTKARVLVVDDSQLACQLVEDGLSSLGYEVRCFNDPFEGLEQVFRLKPDIVLSDLDMPGLDGAELCRRLKSGPARAVPVIILTANDADAQRVGGLRAGAEDYVRKGTSMEELAARIDAIIRRTGATERMRKLFARYTSDAVVEEVLKSGEPVLSGEKREVTVLFADIRNFTALAESLPPEQVVSVLNSVLGKLADAVLTCGGTLDKFLGDGLMAVFGAPVRHDDDALRALQAARMMIEVLRDAQAAEPEQRPGRLPKLALDLPLGIGINSGQVVAGNLGSDQRVEYTCIGDAVNVAARLCAIAGPWEVLVGERTRQLLADHGGFEQLSPVRLKGKSQPVPLYRATFSSSR